MKTKVFLLVTVIVLLAACEGYSGRPELLIKQAQKGKVIELYSQDGYDHVVLDLGGGNQRYSLISAYDYGNFAGDSLGCQSCSILKEGETYIIYKDGKYVLLSSKELDEYKIDAAINKK